MDQIQQHEWEPYGNPNENYHVCPICRTVKLERAFMQPLYYTNHGSSTEPEPACITRPINAPDSDTGEENGRINLP